MEVAEGSAAKRLKTENFQSKFEGEPGTVQFTGGCRRNFENKEAFLRHCRRYTKRLTPTSIVKGREGIKFNPVSRGYILLRLDIETDQTKLTTARWYTIEFCVSKDNFKYPLGDIEGMDGRFRNLRALPPTHQTSLLVDDQGIPFSCFSRKVALDQISDKTSSSSCIPRMLRRRVDPQSVVLDGKLYVMGGDHSFIEEQEPWGEIFDPTTLQWRAMPDPPVMYEDCVMFTAALEEERKILVGAKGFGEILSFNVDDESWDLYDSPDPKAHLPITGPCVVSCGVLYSITEYLCAYDLRNRFYCEATPAAMDLIGEGFCSWLKVRNLRDLGNNNLCVAWMHDDSCSVRVGGIRTLHPHQCLRGSLFGCHC